MTFEHRYTTVAFILYDIYGIIKFHLGKRASLSPHMEFTDPIYIVLGHYPTM